MIPDLSDIFTSYEELTREVDALFLHIRTSQGELVSCVQGCSDCCHALFDLSLVEAMYINKIFAKTIDYGRERSDILSRASDLDRTLTRIKRKFYKDSKAGIDPNIIMSEAARLRLPCPLLDANNSCVLYAYRPITCRLYGVPLNINGQGHVCGKTGFSKGGQYPTVHMNAIYERLDFLSTSIAQKVQSRFKELDQVFVPLSMALLTNYDEQYLGIGPAKKEI